MRRDKCQNILMTMLKVSNEIFPKSLFISLISFFFYLVFLLRTLTNRRRAGENGVDRLNSFIIGGLHHERINSTRDPLTIIERFI